MNREAYFEALSDAIEAIHRMKRENAGVHEYDDTLEKMERELTWECARMDWSSFLGIGGING